jgi:hypothetical protein
VSQRDIFQARVGQPTDAHGKVLLGSITRLGPLVELGAGQTWQYLCPVCLIPELFRGYDQAQARAAVLPKHKACESQAAIEPGPAAVPVPPPALPGLKSARGYVLGGQTYPSLQAVGERAKTLLAWGPGPVTNPGEVAFLRDLLDRHPDAAGKIGPGVAGFDVRRSASFGSFCFGVIRTDGTSSDFSYRVCLERWRSSPTACAKMALRNEVNDQVTAFLQAERRRGPLVDAVTGRPVGGERPHVDHAPPTFAELVGMWLAKEALRLDHLETDGHGDNEDRLTLRDRALAARWQAFHAQHARLQIVTEATNQALIAQRKKVNP